jgi:hypothetical protein
MLEPLSCWSWQQIYGGRRGLEASATVSMPCGGNERLLKRVCQDKAVAAETIVKDMGEKIAAAVLDKLPEKMSRNTEQLCF